MLVVQMLALNFATVVYLAATWVINFTAFGRYTAIIPLALRVSEWHDGGADVRLGFAPMRNSMVFWARRRW